MLVDHHENPLAGRPWARDGVGLHVGQELLIDALRGPPQRQLTQRRQVAWREVALDGALRRLRHVDLARLQPLRSGRRA